LFVVVYAVWVFSTLRKGGVRKSEIKTISMRKYKPVKFLDIDLVMTFGY
jgi:hypothetical protein